MTLIAKVGRAIAGIVELIPGAASVAVGLLPLACIVYLLFILVSCTWDQVAHSPAERRVMQLERALAGR